MEAWYSLFQALQTQHSGAGSRQGSGQDRGVQFLAECYDLERDGGRIAGRYLRLFHRFGERFQVRDWLTRSREAETPPGEAALEAAGDAATVEAPAEVLFLARAPGRINLIGEHTDYNGLPVLPMAVNRDMAALFAPRNDRQVVLSNAEPGFAERTFELAAAIPPFPTGDWGNYVKAGIQGILDYYRDQGQELSEFRGLNLMIQGDIPPASGLSSSSALVVLSALVFLKVNRRQIPGLELAGLMARAEHYVGTQGGGMDQAASLLGKVGQALKINFNPLRTTPVTLPAGYTLVVANSLVRAAKTAEALDRYNRRPIECRLAVAVLKKKFSQRLGREAPIRLLGDLKAEHLGLPEEEVWALADRAFHAQPYRLTEIAELLEEAPTDTARAYCQRRDGSLFPEPAEGFKLHQRYRHVIDEGRRVERSLQALRAQEVEGFGELMNQSHESCRDLYEISCAELDKLVEICRQAGALGARLTGAGFGGCTVSLLEDGRVNGFMEQVVQSYYRDFLHHETEDFSTIIFPCQAVNGAGVFSSLESA